MKDIPGYESLYGITEDGQVWSYPRRWCSGRTKQSNNSHNGKWIAQHRHTGGYLQVVLTKNGKGRMHYVHRLVAAAYIANPWNLPEVNHKDTDKQNNHFSNLEWSTRKQNAAHAKLHGLYKHEPARGEAHPDAKLTEPDVHLIRALWEQDWRLTELMVIFPIAKSSMYSACTGKTWKHL